jgi:hypothetical protein
MLVGSENAGALFLRNEFAGEIGCLAALAHVRKPDGA